MSKNVLIKCVVVAALVLNSVQRPRAQQVLPKLGTSSVKEVVAEMTLEEKAKLLVGMGMELDIPNLPQPLEEDSKTPERVPGAAGRLRGISRLGIPTLTLADGPAGVRIKPIRNGSNQTYYATGFPIATLIASSWDTELAKRVGIATGTEAREYGVDILLSPAMNIQRNPLGGRNFEYYSEDPFLAGKIAASFVNGVQSTGTGTSVKHFAVNNQEFNRMQSNSIVSERALREIYLRGFEIALKESQPWTIMSSYNLINGTYASESSELITTLLRDEWGYKGFVMTDWFGGNDALAQMKAGNELLMPGTAIQIQAIIKAVNDGALSKAQLDRNVERVLNTILQTSSFKNVNFTNRPDLKASAVVAREAATEGMVLLRNEANALPLTSKGKVALFGNAAYDLVAGGSGSGDVNKQYVISLDQGLSQAGITIDDSLRQSYSKFIAEEKAKLPKVPWYLLPPPIPEMAVAKDRLEQLATESDLAIIVLGRRSGEFNDRKVENDFTLAASELGFLEEAAKTFHGKGKKVVAVMNVGGPMEMASWRTFADAILLAWQPGQEGGYAIADILTGKANPSGKLPNTFPVSYSDVPSAKSFPGKELPGHPPLTNSPFAGKPAEAVYEEGIYVGYRYYNTFGVKPAYEFGYGLSYTDFSFSPIKLSSKKFFDSLTATVSIKNTGKVAGKEVVQLYLSAPGQKLKKPESELRGFVKTRLLQPGESQTVTFTITPRDLSSFDTALSSWVAEAGSYTVKVGASSLDIKNSTSFILDRDLVVLKAQRLLAPQRQISELEPK